MTVFKARLAAFLSFLLLMAIACGDDDPATPSGNSSKTFAVVSIVPANGATGVATDAAITITFSENVDANTVVDGVLVTPTPAGGFATTSIGNEVMRTYTTPYPAGTVHTVTVTTALEAESGDTLTSPALRSDLGVAGTRRRRVRTPHGRGRGWRRQRLRSGSGQPPRAEVRRRGDVSHQVGLAGFR